MRSEEICILSLFIEGVSRPNGAGSENSLVILEHEWDSPKVNMFCAMNSSKVLGLFFFVEKTVVRAPPPSGVLLDYQREIEV
ncbi:hypothetical protein TNCV_2328151 [Trichonephila clavipes]|nr:hypothetical protein TNCV_2328151 [Trichonephila clavipes]